MDVALEDLIHAARFPLQQFLLVLNLLTHLFLRGVLRRRRNRLVRRNFLDRFVNGMELRLDIAGMLPLVNGADGAQLRDRTHDVRRDDAVSGLVDAPQRLPGLRVLGLLALRRDVNHVAASGEYDRLGLVGLALLVTTIILPSKQRFNMRVVPELRLDVQALLPGLVLFPSALLVFGVGTHSHDR